MGMHRDQRNVVEGYPSLPVGLVFVPLRVQDRCWFGLICPAEGLFLKEVCTLGVRPGHGLQCGRLGQVVRDRGLVEDVDAGVGFRRCWLLAISGSGGRRSPVRAR